MTLKFWFGENLDFEILPRWSWQRRGGGGGFRWYQKYTKVKRKTIGIWEEGKRQKMWELRHGKILSVKFKSGYHEHHR